jgi:hypothetical protein
MEAKLGTIMQVASSKPNLELKTEEMGGKGKDCTLASPKKKKKYKISSPPPPPWFCCK